MRIEGAIFDLDGTIVDSMGVWHDVTVELLRQEGVPDEEAVFDRTEPEPVEIMCRHFHDVYGAPDSAEVMQERLLACVRDAYRTSVHLYPECERFLRELEAAGVRLCVASATSVPEVTAALVAQGIDDLFEFVISADEVGVGKEEPDIYLEACRRLGTPLGASWVFEDSPVGLASAHAAGLPTVCVFDDGGTRSLVASSAPADILVHGYGELSLSLLEDYERPAARPRGVTRVLVVDGSPQPSSPELVRRLAGESDYVIAVDRGAQTLRAAGGTPDAFCGDADSVAPETGAWARNAARHIIEFPRDKYATDLALSLDCARHEAARRGTALMLTLTCASGGRPDHALAVLGQLACLARERHASVRLVEDGFECRVLRAGGCDRWRLDATARGRTLSAIALEPDSMLSERGLKWELDQRELPPLGDEGVSNVVTSAAAEVVCHAGTLAVFLLA